MTIYANDHNPLTSTIAIKDANGNYSLSAIVTISADPASPGTATISITGLNSATVEGNAATGPVTVTAA